MVNATENKTKVTDRSFFIRFDFYLWVRI